MYCIMHIILDDYMINLRYNPIEKIFTVNRYVKNDNDDECVLLNSIRLKDLDCSILALYKQIKVSTKQKNICGIYHEHFDSQHSSCIDYRQITSKICGHLLATFHYYSKYLETELLKYLWIDYNFL